MSFFHLFVCFCPGISFLQFSHYKIVDWPEMATPQCCTACIEICDWLSSLALEVKSTYGGGGGGRVKWRECRMLALSVYHLACNNWRREDKVRCTAAIGISGSS